MSLAAHCKPLLRLRSFSISTFTSCNNLIHHNLNLLRTTILSLQDTTPSLEYGTYVSLLQDCSNLKALAEGRRLHAHLATTCFSKDNNLNNLLINMYARCKSLGDARTVFDSMEERDAVSWNMIMAAYRRQGFAREALGLFRSMRREGLAPNKICVLIALSACADLKDLQTGEAIYRDFAHLACGSDISVQTAMINMYARCKKIDAARDVFENMSMRDVVTWNGMIAAYTSNRQSKAAIQIFRQMLQKNVTPNRATFLSLLNAFTCSKDLSDGKLVHAYALDGGLLVDCAVGNALISMYARCGSIKNAREVFANMSDRDVVSWTAMIMAYSKIGQIKAALELFGEMRERGVQPNKITFLSLLKGCVNPDALVDGRIIHSCIQESGLEQDLAVRNALISMYGKCGSLEDARAIFNKATKRDVVSWNAIISMHAQHGKGEVAIDMFNQMVLSGLNPDRITLACVLDACTTARDISKGKEVHECAIELGLESDIYVETALLDFYAECGSLEDMSRAFDRMSKRDVVSWSAIIAAHSRHGNFNGALYLFGQMQQEGFTPNKVSFLGILSACSHAGLVDQCFHHYISIIDNIDISPTTKQLGCMIDVLARAGKLEEAEDLIYHMPLKPDAVIWMTLLGACSLHGDVERGLRAAKHLLEMDPGNAATYVTLANAYAKVQEWDDVVRLRKEITTKGSQEATMQQSDEGSGYAAQSGFQR